MIKKNDELDILKTVVEFSSDWMMWIHDAHTIQYISPAVTTITGYQPQEFIDDPNLLKKIIYPEDQELILEKFRNELQNPHTCSIQFRILHKDGSVRWIAHRCRPVFDDAHQMTGRVSSNRDITSQKQAESALQEKEKFLKSIIDGIQDPMHVIDRDYKVVLTNKKLLEMKNVTQDDIRGRYCYDAYQGLGEHCEECAAKKAFATGKPHSLIKTLPLPDGTYRYFEVYGFPLMAENGEVIQVVELTRDITDRKIAFQDMRKMTRIIEQSAEAVAITDTDGNIEYVNEAFEKITGYSLDETKGRNPNILKSNKHTSAYYKDIWETISRGSIWRGQIINKKKNSTLYYEDAVIFPIKDESGKIVNYAKISRDITTQKELEESLKKREEQLRTLINTTPDIICFKDGQGRWLEANDADLKLFQLENVDYRGKKDSELAKYSEFYYDAFMTCEDTDEISWQKGTMSRGIETIPKPDGSQKVYDVIKVPLFDEEGSRKGLVVLGRDVTEMKQAEDKIIENEHKYRLLFENSPLGTFIAMPDGQIIDGNDALLTILGSPSLEATKQINVTTFPPLIDKGYADIFKEVRRTGETRFMEMSYTSKWGRTVYLSSYIVPLKNSAGEVQKIYTIMEDKTEAWNTFKALEESESKNRAMVEAIPDLMFRINKEGIFLDFHAKNPDELLTTPDNIIGRHLTEILPPYLVELTQEKLEKVLKENTPEVYGYHLDRENSIQYFDARMVPRGIDEVLVIVRDISDRKRAEEALTKSEEKYRRIFEDSQDVIFVSSVDGKILDINPAGLHLFGYSTIDDICNTNIISDFYLEPNEHEKYIEYIQKHGFVKDYELHLKKSDGTKLIVLESATAIYDADHNVTAIRGILRDITEKKKLEAQLAQAQKMESIGTLAGGVAHDFNNLLTVINGYSEMALMQLDNGEPLHEDIVSILKAGKQAQNLTSQLLAFSRKQIIKAETLNINNVIASMDKMLRRFISEDIDMVTILANNLPNIKADRSQLEQVFINLIVNARDAVLAVQKTDFQKKITIETGQCFLDGEYVSKHPESQTGPHIFFAVSDTGIGMEEQIKSRVFEPFFTTKEKYKGTGLGLSMIYGIVKQNNASVDVYSEPGEGSIFKIYWPVTDEERTTELMETNNELLYGSERILLVEDKEEVLRFASTSLRSFGYDVHQAANGHLALELIQTDMLEYDLIVTDLVMPELNGKEFIEKVKEHDPTIKVIYVSGYTDNHIVHSGFLQEGINFIQKPYSIKTLTTTVRRVLDEDADKQ